MANDLLNPRSTQEHVLPAIKLSGTRSSRSLFLSHWREQAQRLRKEAEVVYFACKHSRMPWYGRLIAACTAGYLLSPIQLIPSFIPVIGFMDDLLVLYLGIKLLQKIIPPDALAECGEFAAAAAKRRREDFNPARLVASLLIGMAWLLAAIAISILTLALVLL